MLTNQVIKISMTKMDMKVKINFVTVNMKLKKFIIVAEALLSMIRNNIVIMLIL